MSGTFASVAIGREATFLGRLMGLFAQIPILSDFAVKIIHALGMDHDAADLVPKLSFVLFAFIVGALPLLLRVVLHLFLVTTRAVTTGSGANARWAYSFEVFQNYTIPSLLSTQLSAYFFGHFIVIWVVMWFNLHFTVPIVIALSITVGFALRKAKGSYKRIRTLAQPFPLGGYRGINTYLTGGIRFSWFRGSRKEQRQGHTLIVGPSGSGKTSKFIVPGLLEDASNNCSVIAVEAKCSDQEDMFALIAPTWAAASKKVMLFDPWSGNSSEKHSSDPSQISTSNYSTLSFNPLLNLRPSFRDPDTRDAVELVVDALYRTYETEKGSLSGDAQYHADQEKDLLKGILTISLFRPKAERNLSAIAELVHGTVEHILSYVTTTANLKTTSHEDAKDILNNLQWFISANNIHVDSRAKMMRGIAGKLAVFTNPRVIPFVTSNQLDLDLVFREPTLLCIKAPLNVPGATTLASIIIRLLMSKVPHKPAYGAGDDFKIFFYLDELPSLAIPRFAEFCKTARSSGTGIVAAIQDRSDLADIIQPKLGITSIGGLISNFKTQIYLPGLSPDTAKYLSDAFGKTTIKKRRNMRSTTNPVDFNYTTTREEVLLITADQIRNMNQNKAIIVDMNLRPFFIYTAPWYRSMRYRNLEKRNRNVQVKIHNSETEVIEYKPPISPDYSSRIGSVVVRKHYAKKKNADSDFELVPEGFSAPPFSGSIHDGVPFIESNNKKDKNKNSTEDNDSTHFEQDLF